MFFETHDGTRLAYEVYGQGKPIVFLNSLMLTTDMWEYQVLFFAEQGYQCVLHDRRGHGRSDRPPAGYDVDTTADDLAALIEHLDLRDVVLAGHSTGGAEIARYLARHGAERVDRVAFLSATLPFLKQTDDNPGGVPETLWDASNARRRADRPGWLDSQAQVFFATQAGAAASRPVIDWMYRQCLTVTPWALDKLLADLYARDNRQVLREITVPALVVHGDLDFSVPVDFGRRTAELIPHAVYKEYPAAGHGLFVTHAGQLNADLLEFIKG